MARNRKTKHVHKSLAEEIERIAGSLGISELEASRIVVERSKSTDRKKKMFSL